MRGAPQSGFSTLIRLINTRSSMSICGKPSRPGTRKVRNITPLRQTGDRLNFPEYGAQAVRDGRSI
jgi:hypothetical protein